MIQDQWIVQHVRIAKQASWKQNPSIFWLGHCCPI